MNFSKRLWQKIYPFFQEITAHPFNVELAAGELSIERFHFYISQDVSYLKEAKQVFSAIGSRAPSDDLRKLFDGYATHAGEAAESLEIEYLVTCKSAVPSPLSPACREYTHYLMTTARKGSFEEAVAAVLPCFWIYKETYNQMASMVKSSNPYFPWIMKNASQEYSNMTDQFIAVVDEIAAQCADKGLRLMEEVCETCARFEWRFWDDAYHLKKLV